jgi:hypothetical protein
VVRTVTQADVPALGGALARAFDDDPVASFAYPSRRTRSKCLAFYFAKRAATLQREELSWCDEDRCGAALWAPPDRWRVPLRV